MNLLFIDGCISNHNPSRTRILCDYYLQQCERLGWKIQRVDLAALSLQPFNGHTLAERGQAIMEQRFEEQSICLSRQFQQADRIVIGAPYWDLSFPAAVRTYIEQIMTVGITFRYTASGPEGLCKADQLVWITTSGGLIQGENLGLSYLRGIAQMIGIPETEFFSAQGLDISGADIPARLAEAKEKIKEAFSPFERQ